MADNVRKDDPEIEPTREEVARLSELTGGGKRDYWKGYEYLRGILENRGESSGDRHVWFDRAAGINRGDPRTLANDAGNIFIRAVTDFGRQLDNEQAGLSTQEISNEIGNSVVNDIIKRAAIPSLNVILKDDVKAAIKSGDQTIGGWGGAFYYWNAPIEQDDDGTVRTVGDRILEEPREIEKFVAVNAAALEKTLRSEMAGQPFYNAEIGAMLGLAAGATLPERLRVAIVERAFRIDQGESYLDDPDFIDGFRRDAETGEWRNARPEPEETDMRATPAQAREFERRRAYRLENAERARFEFHEPFDWLDLPSVPPQPEDPDRIGVYDYDRERRRWSLAQPGGARLDPPQEVIDALDILRERRLRAKTDAAPERKSAPEPRKPAQANKAPEARRDQPAGDAPAARQADPAAPAPGPQPRIKRPRLRPDGGLGRPASAQAAPQTSAEPRPAAPDPAEIVAQEAKALAAVAPAVPAKPPKTEPREIEPYKAEPRRSEPRDDPAPVAPPPLAEASLGRKRPDAEAAAKRRKALVRAAGGQSRFDQMTDWAASTLPGEETEKMRADLAGDDVEAMTRSVAGVYQRFESAHGLDSASKPKNYAKPKRQDDEEDGLFLSPMQVVGEMRRREYKTDPPSAPMCRTGSPARPSSASSRPSLDSPPAPRPTPAQGVPPFYVRCRSCGGRTNGRFNEGPSELGPSFVKVRGVGCLPIFRLSRRRPARRPAGRRWTTSPGSWACRNGG